MSNYSDECERKERRCRITARTVCVVIAVAFLAALAIPAVFSGL